MRKKSYSRALGALLLLVLPLLLSGCSSALLDPKGQIGEEQRTLIITAFVLMLIVVIPVIVMTLLFAYRYRRGNPEASYKPNWAHSTAIEIVVWFIPCVIIVVLAILTWHTSHDLDPMKPIEADANAMEIQAVSLDWKWLFIYPEQGVATINEVAMPVDRPIRFRISSGSVMNAFFIPTLGTQIYAMAGMDSNLYLIANQEGTYDGRSTNYSGAGFSGMTFQAHALSEEGFQDWVNEVKASPDSLSYEDGYPALAEPSRNAPVQYFSNVSDALYNNILESFRGGEPQELGLGGEEHGAHGHGAHGKESVNAEAAE